MSTEKKKTADTQETAIAEKKEHLEASKRFTERVLNEFGSSISGALQVTEFQKSLIQGYFIEIDRVLKKAEEERLRKNAANADHKYDNNLAFSWNTVNLNDLAIDLMHYARVGLDMTQDNMLFPIPFKNNKRECYDITLMEGYNGKRYIGEKYALDVPTSVTVEVVYSTDVFRPIKKGENTRTESYYFEITNPFDRGDIVGGFAYLEFSDASKNKLVIMSMKDVMKRKPQHASINFWGGKQKIWENGKQVEVEAEGWLDEMVRKTIIREAYSAKHLPRDPKKVDDSYQYMKLREARFAEIEAQQEISAKANSQMINVDIATGEVVSESLSSANSALPQAVSAPIISGADDLP